VRGLLSRARRRVPGPQWFRTPRIKGGRENWNRTVVPARKERAAHDLLSVGGRKAQGNRDVSPTVSRSSDLGSALPRIGYRSRAQVRLRLAVPRSPRLFEHGAGLTVAKTTGRLRASNRIDRITMEVAGTSRVIRAASAHHRSWTRARPSSWSSDGGWSFTAGARFTPSWAEWTF